MADEIKLETRDGVAVLILNRPDAGNAINAAMGLAFAQAVDAIAGESAVRAVLLTGSGTSFCVGGDIGEMRQHADTLPALMEQGIPRLHQAVARLAALRCPLVTAVKARSAAVALAWRCAAISCSVRNR